MDDGMDGYRVRTVDGWELAVRTRRASDPGRRGAALLLPAMMVDSRTLDKPVGDGLAATIARAGFDVHVADFRGHGGSGPKVSDGGRWSYDDLVQHDVPALLAGVAERSGGPVWVVGHSLGAHVSLACSGTIGGPVVPHGHVLIAGNVWMPSLEGSRRRTLRKDVTIRMFRRVVQAVGHWPSRAIRMGNVDESAPYVEDLCRFWLQDGWRDRAGRLDYLAGLRQVQGPVLCVAGAGDAIMGHVEGVRAFAERLGPGRAEFLYARRGEHGLDWDPGHMGLVTDPRSRPLWEDIAAFMRART